MIGYQVVHNFDSTSYFITRSCLFKPEESDDESEDYDDYRNPSEYSMRSIRKQIAGTEYDTSNHFNSSEHRTLLEDTTS